MIKIQDIRHRTPKRSTTRNVSSIKTIVRHHSGTNNGDFDSFWNNRWKGLGWQTGGYAEIILRDGTVQLCYDPNMVTNGVLDHNSYTYHICVVGNGSFTEAQEKAFEERCKLAMSRFNITVENVKGHGEITPTECPGINMNMVRNRLKEVKYVQANVKYDGKSVNGIIIDNRTYVQVRDLAELLKLKVEWEQKTKTVTLRG